MSAPTVEAPGGATDGKEAALAMICTKPGACPCAHPCDRLRDLLTYATWPALQGNLEGVV